MKTGLEWGREEEKGASRERGSDEERKRGGAEFGLAWCNVS